MPVAEARRREVAHDEAPSNIIDHPFEPRGAWYDLCKHCGLAEAAHLESTIDSRAERRKDQIARYGEVRYATDAMRIRDEELERVHAGGRVRIGYYSDDNAEEE